MTKIDIVSGFLGAGKTTFIKRVLEIVKNEKTVLIENEFGEVGIDGGFLEDSGIEIKEMNSGCICCSLVGDFTSSLKEILEKYEPQRVIIEPSGVGKLSDVMKAVELVESKLKIEPGKSVTVVDASKCKMYAKNFGEFFNNQIQYADIIVLSRTDIADEKKQAKAVEIVREINPTAKIITTPLKQLDNEQIFEILEKDTDLAKEMMEEEKNKHHEHGEGCGCGHHEGHEHHHHEEHHHEHGEGCGCGHDHEGYEHHHDEHHHEHGEGCGCGHDHEGHGHHHHDEHHHEHGEGCGCGHHHHHADEVFESWGKEQIERLSRQKLEDILEKLSESSEYGVVLRAKGMVELDDNTWAYFDLVPGEVELRDGKACYTSKACVIGANLEKEKLEELFKA